MDLITINYILMERFNIKVPRLFSAALDVILPSVCANCGAEAFGAELLCSRCSGSIIVRKAPRKTGSRFLFSAGDYKDPAIRSLIKTMKYSGVWKAGYPLADLMLRHFEISGFRQMLPKDGKIFIVPVPIHFLKKWKRGFNQSEILSDIIGQKLGAATVKALNRRGWTPPQSKIADDKTRSLNITGCFSLSRRAKDIPPKSMIILLDDVVTSGSTIKEAARALRPLHPSLIVYASTASR